MNFHWFLFLKNLGCFKDSIHQILAFGKIHLADKKEKREQTRKNVTIFSLTDKIITEVTCTNSWTMRTTKMGPQNAFSGINSMRHPVVRVQILNMKESCGTFISDGRQEAGKMLQPSLATTSLTSCPPRGPKTREREGGKPDSS